ncbi:hypothetical protein JCM16814_11520 [Desulfobaculum senezii]|jgi:hypothetical protein
MKIAVEITVFNEVITKVVEYPGIPQSHAEVIRWLMAEKIDLKWTDYENAPVEDKFVFDLKDGVSH